MMDKTLISIVELNEVPGNPGFGKLVLPGERII